MADDPQRHEAYPSAVHRCHLWSLHEQIDTAHQRAYCFTEAHRRCPWLSVPPHGRKAADRSLPKGKIAASGGALALLGGIAALVTSGWAGLGDFSLGQGRVAAAPVAAVAAAVAPAPPVVARKPVVVTPNVVRPFGELSPALLAADAPRTVSAQLDSDAGGTVLAGSVGLSFSPKSLSEMPGGATVHVEAHPKANVPGGPAQFSPSGSIVDITVHDTDGKLVTTFPEPVEILFKYNDSDLAMAHGNPNELRAAYVLDADSPAIENPNHFPINTWVFFPPDNLTLDTTGGTIGVRTQAIGSIFSVVGVGVGWAQTVRNAELYSSFDPAKSVVFGTKKQGSYVRMVEPQIGSRLLVLNVDSGNYAYMNARDLKPSAGPQAPKTGGT
jgi:hypothetical protein